MGLYWGGRVLPLERQFCCPRLDGRGILSPMPLARVVINLGGLNIKIEQEAAYPDMVTDLCNRAAVLFGTSVAQAKAAELDIMASTWVDYGDDVDEDED